MLVQSEGSAKEVLLTKPELNRKESLKLAQSLFPDDDLEALEDGDLLFTSPPDEEILVGVFGGVNVLAAKEFGGDFPSKLSKNFISRTGFTTLHAMHSVVDWFAFTHWQDGKLIRSLSMSPDSGILEDIGGRMDFELPYWEGKHPAVEEGEEDEYPFIFHPLELGEEALSHFFGYQIEGTVDKCLIDPEEFPLLRFRRSKQAQRSQSKSWWQFWK